METFSFQGRQALGSWQTVPVPLTGSPPWLADERSIMFYYQFALDLPRETLERALSLFLSSWFLGRKPGEDFMQYMAHCMISNQNDFFENNSHYQGCVDMEIILSPTATRFAWAGQFSPDRHLVIEWRVIEEGLEVRANLEWDKSVADSSFFERSGLGILPWALFAEGSDLQLAGTIGKMRIAET